MSIFRRDSDRNQPSPTPDAPPTRPERPAAPARQSAPPTASEPKSAAGGQATRIASGSRFVGEISGSAELVVEGRVEGQIDLHSRVVVGEKGRVEGKVRAETVEVAGRIAGNVIGEKRVQVLESGRLEGDVLSPRVVIAEGAFFKGKVEMTDKIPPRAGSPAGSKGPKTIGAEVGKSESSGASEPPKGPGQSGGAAEGSGGGSQGSAERQGSPQDRDRGSRNERREPSTAGSRKG